MSTDILLFNCQNSYIIWKNKEIRITKEKLNDKGNFHQQILKAIK